jgi:hypothetical protein
METTNSVPQFTDEQANRVVSAAAPFGVFASEDVPLIFVLSAKSNVTELTSRGLFRRCQHGFGHW